MKKIRQVLSMTAIALVMAIVLGSGTALVQAAPADDLVISGVFDGSLTGGQPKGIELTVINNIPDLSIYGIGSANNGGGSDGEEFTFPAVSVDAGTCIWIANQASPFTDFFGFPPSYTAGAMAINGDDAIELFANGSVSDTFGDINVDGTGEPWEYVDGWAYREQSTSPDGNSFILGNWNFSGVNGLEGGTDNATANSPFPVGTYPSSGNCPIPDAAPEVASTTPADGSGGVALDANIEITFSEDVTATDPWVSVSCSVSGSHTAVISGGPATYTVDPDSDFVNDETCTVTVTASQVVDQDGTADNMAVDFAFTFATESSIALPNLVINEIHADPDGSIAGDANGDGTRDGSADEFVEIVNNNGSDVDISGWTLSDGFGVRHVFPPGSVILDGCALVVFGGNSPTGAFGGSVVQTASTNSVGLNNGGDTVTLNNGSSDVAVYAYGSEGGANQSLTRDPDVTGTDPLVQHTSAAGANGALYSPGTQVDGSSFSGCPVIVSLVLIHEIQGNGAASPLSGQTVMIEGIVVGDFQDGAAGVHGDLNGFFVQEEDSDADSDAETSEGIFVFDGSNPAVDVAVGDVVRVTGPVSEFNGMTQITSFSGVSQEYSVLSLPTAAAVTLPVASDADFEAVEGMSVSFPQTLTIVEYFNFDRFGEMVLATDRLFQPTAIFAPGSIDAANLADLNSRSRITLDDGRTSQNPDPAIHPNGDEFTLTNRFRGGDLVTDATGVLNYAFGQYRIQPTQGADYSAVNPRTADHEPVGGSLEVASFNVLNYFTTLDSRGADDAEEFTRQRDKIFAALADIDADIVGLIEIENNGTALTDLVDGLNNLVGAGTYAALNTGPIGTDQITVAFIYKPAAVSLVGNFAVLDTPAFVSPNTPDPKNRPALAQTFIDNNTGGVFTAVVNHLKSKGSGCGPGDDDAEQGSCNLTRTLAAQALVDWLATDPTGSGDADVLILGDLNAYDKEDPIQLLVNAGYADLEAVYGGEYAYSYVFSGQFGYLDYAMANADLLDEVTGAATWHINSDEPDLLDYDTSFKKPAQDALYEANAYRASDHDPIIVGLDVCDEIAPTVLVFMTPNQLWPPNHQYVDVAATVVPNDNFDQNPTVTLVSVTSNEPDNGKGDGNTINDIVIVDDTHFQLRAERSGKGNGRTYTVTYEVTDSCGNSAVGSAEVFVPKNQGKK